jgi:Spy/CpxP family protein refolding chaperone
MKQLVLLLVALTTVTFSQGAMQHGGRRGKGGALCYEHNLSQEQYQKLKSIREASYENISIYRDSLKSIRTEMIKVYNDNSKVKKLAEKAGSFQTKLSLEVSNQLQKISKILSKEQMDKFIEIRIDRYQYRAGHKKGNGKRKAVQ